eukprot:g17674.t1
MTSLLSGSTIATQEDALERSLEQFNESSGTVTELYTGVGQGSEKLVALVFAAAKESGAKVEQLGGGICRITKSAAK